MSTNLHCLKTGCGLIVPDHGQVWGDLHYSRVTRTWIFMAVTDRFGYPAWEEPNERDMGPMIATVTDGAFCEKSGVIVIPFEKLQPSELLANYLNESAKRFGSPNPLEEQ
jgi:hypothetical protein